MGTHAQPTVALTGTPGTGKSSAARALMDLASQETPGPKRRGKKEPRTHSPAVMEVAELALRLGYGQYERADSKLGRLVAPVEVDMHGLSAAFQRLLPFPRPFVLVGHLSHLLPVDAILLLRCDPREIERRLRVRGDKEEDVRENVEAELVDVILFEALERKIPVYERDTTREAPKDTARWILRVLGGSERPLSTALPFRGTVDWLASDEPLMGETKRRTGNPRAARPSKRGP